MIELVVPSERYRESVLAAEAEEHRHGFTEENFDSKLRGIADFAAGRDLKPGRIAQTTLWLVDGDAYIGRIAIRHKLTPLLLAIGGHVGYDVRPSQRRQGHATRMLRMAIPHIAALGIDPALVTCDVDNIASRKVIESCGGTPATDPVDLGAARAFTDDEEAHAMLAVPHVRYWLPTAR